MGIRFRSIFPIFVGLFVSGCATVNVYDMPSVQANLSTALQHSEQITQKAQNDFSEKKTLVDNLSKMNTPAQREAQTGLRAYITQMQASLDRIAGHRKAILAANAEIASLAYGKREVQSGQREYAGVDSSVKSFEAAADEINLELVNYSRASNSLAEEVSTKKLFFGFEPADFHKRVQQSIRVSQENLRTMQNGMDRNQEILGHSSIQPSAKKIQQDILSNMEMIAKQYTAKAQRFSEINREVQALTPAGRITSLDPNWNRVQKLVNEYELNLQEVVQLNARFQQAGEAFRDPSKRAP